MKQYKVEITKRSFAGYGRYIQLYCYRFALLQIMQWGNIIALLMKYLH